MTDRDELEDRLDALEDEFGVGPTHRVVVGGDAGEWPDGVDEDAITHRYEVESVEPGETMTVEEPVVPRFRPPEYRGGIVLMSKAEIATVYDAMPDDVRREELETRIENGDPIPPVLQQ